ncbi:hypothetical protein HanXRQr2_Chr08g0329281 [Helianthus annuus]|uniref:Uncharacterized protein n=1 Tax=Helianthus annuus TaxID=4232 RepID=A0A251U4M0_HELAN|nr:hypothetical protein HanXRQr2_Chr08g0329281 [Helianthus annuus]
MMLTASAQPPVVAYIHREPALIWNYHTPPFCHRELARCRRGPDSTTSRVRVSPLSSRPLFVRFDYLRISYFVKDDLIYLLCLLVR